MGAVGIPDEESWFRTAYLPSGRATGWRRVVAVALAVITVIGLVIVLVVTFTIR